MTQTETIKLTTDQAVAFLGSRGFPINRITLLRLCRAGAGPRFIVWGIRNLYDPADLLEWAHSRGKPMPGGSKAA